MLRRGLLVGAVGLACAPAEGDSVGDTSTTAPTTSDATTATLPTTSGPDTSTSDDPSTTATTAASDELFPDPGPDRYALVGEMVVLDGAQSTGAVAYQWNPGDGSPAGPKSASPVFEVDYASPGRYKPILTVFDDQGTSLAASVTITVTAPPTWQPRHSSTVVRVGQRVAVASPDANEVMVASGDGRGNFAVERYLSTAAKPRTLAALDAEWLAIACQDAAVLEVRRADGTGPVHSLNLPEASQPFGVVALSSSRVVVSLQATGQLADVAVAADEISLTQLWDVGHDVRGVAALPDGRVAVTRWRSQVEAATIWAVDLSTGERTTWSLAFDPQAASDTEIGGIPSYLAQVVLDPTGTISAIPGLQANIGQGLYFNGEPLEADTTVRAIVSFVDPTDGSEWFAKRKQFDNRGLASAAVFSRFGDYLYVATRGPRTVERIDVFSEDVAGNIFDVGYAPEGLVLSEDDAFLFVDATLSRELVVYDTRSFADPAPPVARLPSVSSEPLAPQVLRGKQLFNDSADPRLSKDNYMACAHCHLDGESDLQVWDFTDRGEGVRDTHALVGRAGTGDGPIHWSANFDEVQDFEHDIRGPFGGSGLLSDADWAAHDDPLGAPKAGLSPDLDALAIYLATLSDEPRSPYRDPGGILPPAAEAGRLLFESPALGCTTCHLGPRLTDSQFIAQAEPLLHDVGTFGPGSGQRLGQPLTGLDTPTLHGLWRSAPYLHDGSAPDLEAVLTSKNPLDLHGVTSMLSASERAQLIAYLLCLDGEID